MVKLSAAATILSTLALQIDAFSTSRIHGKAHQRSTCPATLSTTSITRPPSTSTSTTTTTSTSTWQTSTSLQSEAKPQSEPTLYEILNSNPEATKPEIKKQYVQLVKKSHPDALISNNSNISPEEAEIQFRKITAAWKILSDPLERKRYDRELRAQAFTENVENVMGDFAATAGPQFLSAFENVAIPFLRRSAATTQAVTKAVARDIQNYNEKRSSSGAGAGANAGGNANDGGSNMDAPNGVKDGKSSVGSGVGFGKNAKVKPITNVNANANANGAQSSTAPKENIKESKGLGAILTNAIQASQEAGKVVDRIELLEKSRDLRKQSERESREAAKMQSDLDQVIRRRAQLMLHTPNSQLSSLEASMILDGFNIADGSSGSFRLRKTVTEEIEQLQMVETELSQRKEREKNLSMDIERKTLALDQARINSAAAVQAEERARKALEDAISLVQSTAKDEQNALDSLNVFREDKKVVDVDIDRWNVAMTRQQERVRNALRNKEQLLQQNSELSGDDMIIGDFDAKKALNAQVEVQQLLKKEKFLRAESARLQDKANRTKSRSEKLKKRADGMEEEEEKVYQALEEGIKIAKTSTDGTFGQYRETLD